MMGMNVRGSRNCMEMGVIGVRKWDRDGNNLIGTGRSWNI